MPWYDDPSGSGAAIFVQGTVADAAAAAGNPVPIGGIVNTTRPTYTNLQRAQAQFDVRGNLGTAVYDAGGNRGANVLAAGDGLGLGNSGLLAISYTMVENGATMDMQRTPRVFKTVSATASGNTALWTPTTGKKFRLMRLLFDLTSNAGRAAGGVVTFSLQDNTTDIGVTFDVFVPTTAVTTGFGGYTSGWIDLGNGVLSTAANNVLNLNLSAALTSGVCRVSCCGTEE